MVITKVIYKNLMAENSKIGWTDHTFNPWVGCHKHGPACKFCYAESFTNRFKKGVWGLGGTREVTSDAYWKQPIKWNKKAKELGIRYRVFCGSFCDVMEDHEAISPETRDRLYDLVEATPNLDWLFLTKRPHNYVQFLRKSWIGPNFPQNVWLGCTITSQEEYDKMWPEMHNISSVEPSVLFVSCEPLLGNIIFNPHYTKPDWIILGGESGPITKIRKLDLTNVSIIVDQIKIYGEIKLFVKQLGSVLSKQYKLNNKAATDITEWPNHLDWLKIQEIPFYN
jgi:protein gp37